MSNTASKVAISGLAAVILATRHFFPGVFDTTDIVLIAAILMPWVASLVKSAELPGGFKIEFQEVERAGAKVTVGRSRSRQNEDRGQRYSSFVEISESDPNLALVSLRIEIERRLRMLARLYGLPERQPLMRLFRELQRREVLTDPTLGGLQELVMFGNQAAHGAIVEPDAAKSAIEFGPEVLAILDDTLRREGAMYKVGEKPGKGTYCCTNCNWSVRLDDDDDRLPPCGNCGAGPNTTYVRC